MRKKTHDFKVKDPIYKRSHRKDKIQDKWKALCRRNEKYWTIEEEECRVTSATDNRNRLKPF